MFNSVEKYPGWFIEVPSANKVRLVAVPNLTDTVKVHKRLGFWLAAEKDI